MAILEDGTFQRRPKDNPKMVAEKLKNQAKKLPSKYTVKTGDSWFKIAGKLYGGLYKDPLQAQKMAEQLARANPNIKGLKGGTVIKVAKPRSNPRVSGAFIGDAGASGVTAPVPSYTGPVLPQAQQQVAQPNVNYNAASTQGRPWATPAANGLIAPAPAPQYNTYAYQNNQNRPWVDGQQPWNPQSQTSLLFDASGQPRPLVNKSSKKSPAITKTEPVYDRTYLPGKAPAQPAQGLGYKGYTEPVTVTRNRPPATQTTAPVSDSRAELLRRASEMDPNESVGFTSIVDQLLAHNIRPIFIYETDRNNLGITTEYMTAMGYQQNPMTGTWIRLGAAQIPQAGSTPSSTAGWGTGSGAGGYSPGFRGGGGGGTYGGGGYGYTGTAGYSARQPSRNVEAERLIREAGIGLISWRI